MVGVRLDDPATQNPYRLNTTVRGSYGLYGTPIAAWTVLTLGTLVGTASAGITLAAGGIITNGSAADATAAIAGLTAGVFIAGGAGRVTNFGTIMTLPNAPDTASAVEIAGGLGLVTNSGKIAGARGGIRLDQGGTVVNGSSGDLQAMITGRFAGVGAYGGLVTVVNRASIVGGQIGVNLQAGGTLTNGADSDPAAAIRGGAFGVLATEGPAVLVNFGTIDGSVSSGVQFFDGGTVTNGSLIDRSALITSYLDAIRFETVPGSVVNFGRISSDQDNGVLMSKGGSVTNGSPADRSASITSKQGYGVRIIGNPGTVLNYGLIAGVEGINFAGAQIETVVNSGTIVGSGGTAISFAAGSDRLIDDPGSVIVGNVIGGARSNTLELASSASIGTISGLGASFVGFGTILVDTGASWRLNGQSSIGPGDTLTVLGTLAAQGRVTGSVTIAGGGELLNKAHSTITGGVFGVGGPVTVTNDGEMVNPAGAGISLAAGGTVTNAGTITGSAGTAVAFGGGDGVLVCAPGAAFVGGVTAAAGRLNRLELASGASSGRIDGIGSVFRNFGTIALDARARWTLAGPNTLASGGTLSLGAAGTLGVAGSFDAGSILTLAGSGTVGVSPTGSVEIGTGSDAIAGHITVDRGAALIGSGTLNGSVFVSGSIVARAGTLAVDGVLSGAGTVAIDHGAVLACSGRLRTATIQFIGGAGGALLAADPEQITGRISGFGTLGSTDRIDLLNFAVRHSAVSSGTLALMGTAGAATIRFAGNYSSPQLHVASDGHGGTNITFV